MTAQNNGMVEFEGENYFFETPTSDNLSALTNIQVAPFSGDVDSGVRRFLEYQITNNELSLKELYVDIYYDQKAPAINGVNPTLLSEEASSLPTLFSHGYRNMNLPIRFTGTILLKTDFIGEFSVQMGFHPTWGARKAIELVFEEGTLVKQRNVSKLMAEFRKLFIRVDATPGQGETEKWGKENFASDYGFYSNINNSELFEEEENKMKWGKYIVLGIIACLAGFLLKQTSPVQENVKLSVIVAAVMLGGFGLLNSGLLGLLASHKKITLKGK